MVCPLSNKKIQARRFYFPCYGLMWVEAGRTQVCCPALLLPEPGPAREVLLGRALGERWLDQIRLGGVFASRWLTRLAGAAELLGTPGAVPVSGYATGN